MIQRLLIACLLVLVPILAQATVATLPQLQVDTTMPSTSVTKTVCASGCDYTNSQLQTAIDDAVLGTKILLQPGITYQSTSGSGFRLRNKTSGSGWIIIQTDTTLPAEGVRATAADATNYAKILRPTGTPNYALSTDATAHHYRIIGVEFMNPGDVDIGFQGAFVKIDTEETTLETQTHHVIFDRIYMHGPPAGHASGVLFGVSLQGQYEAVIDSTILDITHGGGESKAINSAFGAGPFLVRNNFLSAAGENIFFGGSDPIIANLVPSDITVINNHFFKPLKWRDDPAYNTAPNPIRCKNLFELKNAQRVLVNGNIFENMWPSAQVGFALTITPRQANGPSTNPADNHAPWTVVQDLTITNNIIKNSANGIAMGGGVGSFPPTVPGGRFTIKNNLLIGIGGYAGTGLVFQVGNGIFDLTIQHNTVASMANVGTVRVGTTLNFGLSDAQAASVHMDRFIWKDNIFLSRAYTYKGSGCTLPTMDAQAPGYVWTNTVWAGPWPSQSGCVSTSLGMPQGNGNAYPASEALVLYTNPSIDDYSLSAASPYRNAASDGTDIGVNWPQLQAELAHSSGGTPTSDVTPPVLSTSSTTLEKPAGTTSTTVTVTSDEAATVKYGLSDVAYASLPSTATANGLSHTTASITGLTDNSTTPVYFRGQDTALNTDTTSLVVNIHVAATPADTTKPSDVTGLAGVSLASGLGITYTWNTATDTPPGVVAKYQPYLCTSLPCTPTVPAGGQPLTTTVTITGLTPATGYSACVRAIDDSGNVSLNCSATVDVTTAAVVGPGAPVAPTGLKVLATAAANARFGTYVWARSTETDLAGYRVYQRLSDGTYGTMIKEITPAVAYAEKHPMEQWRFIIPHAGINCFAVSSFNQAQVEGVKSIEVCLEGAGMTARAARQ